MTALETSPIAIKPAPVVPTTQPASVPPRAVSKAPIPWWHLRPIFLFLLIGTLFRVTLLSQPSLWGDEAATFMRSHSGYRDMMDYIHQNDAFAPLHYEEYWLLSRWFQMIPPVMRLIPLVGGILMIPAMYFLALQLVNRWAANLVALFTSCSAYMLVYSRDAKMYPLFWTLCALSMGCFFWWINSAKRVAWLAWVAAGVAVVGTHTPGLSLLFLPPIVALTCTKPSWKKGLLTLAGVLVMITASAVYYMTFNSVAGRADTDSFSQASGTQWVAGYNNGRSGPEHLLYTATAYLFSWEWPRDGDQQSVDPNRLWWLQASACALGGAILLGVFPWPSKFRAFPGWAHGSSTPWRWWNACLWLTLWLAVPAYWFYCKSVEGFVAPSTWPAWVGSFIDSRWLAIGIGTVALSATVVLLENGLRWVALPVGVAALFLVNACLLPRTMESDQRYLMNAIIIGLTLIFYGAGPTIPRRILNVVSFAAIVAIAMCICQGIFAAINPQQPSGSIWMPRYLAVIWPAFAISLAVLISRLPTAAVRYAVIGVLLIVNLKQFADRVMANVNYHPERGWVITGDEPPIDIMSDDVFRSDTPRRERLGSNSVVWSRHSNLRFIGDSTPPQFSPGLATLTSFAGIYYLTELGEVPVSLSEFHEMYGSQGIYMYDQQNDPAHIAQVVAAQPSLQSVIVWDRFATAPIELGRDPVLRQLGRGWDLISTMQFQSQVHWYWQNLDIFRRREYRRTHPPTAKSHRRM